MLQELFRVPGFGWPIYSYGLMMVIGFLCAIQLAKMLSRRFGIDPELFVNAGLIALVTGVIGARLSHVIENIGQYTTITADRSAWDNFIDAINIRSGGLTYYGGFLLAFPSLVLYALWKKMPLRLGMDIAAPCIMIGLAFGRIGCFLNGCCHGDVCDLPWAVRFPYQSFAYEQEFIDGKRTPPEELLAPGGGGHARLITRQELEAGRLETTAPGQLPIPIDPRARELAALERSLPLHPAQLYSAITAFLIAGVVYAYFTLQRAPGRAFALMLMLEGSTRFLLEMLRVEPPVYGPFSLSMLLGIGLAALGAVLWLVFGQIESRHPPLPAAAT